MTTAELKSNSLGPRQRPSSEKLDEMKSKYVPNALESLTPTYIKKGKGAVVWDVDGNQYIDLTGGWGCLAVGYEHPKVVDAVIDQAKKFFHTDFTAIPYSPFVKLAKKISELAHGETPKKTAFFNSGAEAVENAIKIARAHTNRPGVVVFENAFHGRTLLTMTMTHQARPYKNGFGPFASDVYRLPYPNPYRTSMKTDSLEKKLLHLVDPQQVAAMVVEPIIGEGGFLIPPDDFLPYLRELSNKYGIDLIFDEIQAGVGRTGKFFSAEHWGVEPDMATLAKSLAGGLPLSAVVGKTEIMDAPTGSSIGGTYVGNPIACRAALAVTEVIEEENLLERAEKLGQKVRDRFKEMQSTHQIIGDVRGKGMMNAMEFVKDRESKEPASEEVGEIVQTCLKEGVILGTAGLDGNVIRLLPPLVIKEDHLHFALDKVEEVIARVTS
ncbi:MAG: aspartate aminotransferase family protein [Candidatus Bipolaricaulota bacterium]